MGSGKDTNHAIIKHLSHAKDGQAFGQEARSVYLGLTEVIDVFVIYMTGATFYIKHNLGTFRSALCESRTLQLSINNGKISLV